MMRRWLTLLVLSWTGAVLAIALIAAPAAFAVLPDRALAGAVAAQLFKVEAYGSVVLAAALWLVLRPSVGAGPAGRAPWPAWTALLVVLIATILGYFGLADAMQAAKAQYGSASPQYLRLHGLSMALYALKALGWVVLGVLLTRRTAGDVNAKNSDTQKTI
jgi:hypothetical protein